MKSLLQFLTVNSSRSIWRNIDSTEEAPTCHSYNNTTICFHWALCCGFSDTLLITNLIKIDSGHIGLQISHTNSALLKRKLKLRNF